MDQYIIVPHTQRNSTKVTLNNGKTINILHDPKSKGYNSPNEDPFVRYKSAWFYSFCHTNITLSSDVRSRIKNEKIKFIFISTEKNTKDQTGYPVWIIDTVIQLKDIIEIDNKHLNLGEIVDAIAKNKNVNANKKDIKNIIAKHHLPKFCDIQSTYNKNAYWSNEHFRPKSSSVFLGVADMNESYFPFNKKNESLKISEENDEGLINNSIIKKMITRNANNRYYPIKLLDDKEPTKALKEYKEELKQLHYTLDLKLKSKLVQKIKAKDIKSNKQGFIIP